MFPKFNVLLRFISKIVMDSVRITSALLSVYDKTGLNTLVEELDNHGVTIYSTGGTYDFITQMGIKAIKVEDLTGFPSMLDGRVKTLHPAVFGGILARRDEDHLGQLKQHNLPVIDLVVVDLYPFEETLRNTSDDQAIIDKIDIGGVSLLRAAAKNHHSVVVISKQAQYPIVTQWIREGSGNTTLEQRIFLAYESFQVTAHYDTVIGEYFAQKSKNKVELRYGENPQQKAYFIGNTHQLYSQLAGKALSYNNIIDMDSAIHLISDFKNDLPTFAIIKHTNPCGIATRNSVLSAWEAALACDPTSAFGGILVCNKAIDVETANAIDHIFYEVVIAPEYLDGALEVLKKKKNRTIIELHTFATSNTLRRTVVGGTLVQENDLFPIESEELKLVTTMAIPEDKKPDLTFAIKCVKHLKSNAISIVKNQQMIGSGVGQTSRVDALKQAITKAKSMGFNLKGSILASDAFFPFADSIEIAYNAEISYIVQPGGSIKDNESIQFCEDHQMAMYFTGMRHFKH